MLLPSRYTSILAAAGGLIAVASAEPMPVSLILDAVDDTSGFSVQGHGYTGTIPSEIGLLSKLTHGLELGENSFTGRLPSEIGWVQCQRGQLKLSRSLDFFLRLLGAPQASDELDGRS